jgi:biopolymer transport protein ExbB/TolQ
MMLDIIIEAVLWTAVAGMLAAIIAVFWKHYWR